MSGSKKTGEIGAGPAAVFGRPAGPVAPAPALAPDAAQRPAAQPVDVVVLAMISGHKPEAAARGVGVPEDQIAGVVAEARRRLTLAADVNRDQELGLMISQLNDLYRRAFKPDGEGNIDVRTCLSILDKKARLIDLHRPTVGGDAGGSDAARAELAQVRGYLLPLKLADEDAPTPELARLAVARLVNLSSEHAEQ